MLAAIAVNEAPKTETAYRAFCAALDKGAKHGIIAKNTAIRKKARAATMLRADAAMQYSGAAQESRGARGGAGGATGGTPLG